MRFKCEYYNGIKIRNNIVNTHVQIERKEILTHLFSQRIKNLVEAFGAGVGRQNALF